MSERALRILLIEDNPGDARLLREAFAGCAPETFEITWAQDLASGLQRLSESTPDAVLLDFSLPDGKGLYLLERVQERSPRVPIVVLTSLQDESVAGQAVRAGAQDYLVKGKADGPLISRSIRYAIERKKMEEEHAANLERQKELARLRDVDKFKSNLLNIVSHELGTPLTPIEVQLYILEGLDVVRNDRHLQAIVHVLRRNLDRLLSVVQGVLDASRMEAGQFSVDRASTDLTPALLNAAQVYAPLAQKAGVQLEAFCEPELRVFGDGPRLARVVAGMLNNAIKFTPRGGSIRLEGVRDTDHVVVSIRDTGRGLKPEEITQLFQPFSQVHDPMQITDPGSGLGLYIARRIIEFHEGRLWCESPGPGRGSTFSFRIALEKPMTPQPIPAGGARQR